MHQQGVCHDYIGHNYILIYASARGVEDVLSRVVDVCIELCVGIVQTCYDRAF